MKKLLFLILALSFGKGIACTCHSVDLERELKYTSAIVHVKVLKIEYVSKWEIFTNEERKYLENEYDSKPEFQNLFRKKSVTKVKVRLVDTFKGNFYTDELTIFTSMHGPSCGYFGFKEGKEFIVFLTPEILSKRLFGNYNKGVNKNRLWTNTCSRTSEFDEVTATEIIEGLDKLK